MNCPRCATPLEQVKIGTVLAFSCRSCHGQAITLEALRTLGVSPENTTAIWRSASAGKLGKLLTCPECGNQMRVIKLDDGSNIFYIDVCISCHLIWFDFGELNMIPVVQLPANFISQLPYQMNTALTNSGILQQEISDDAPPTFLDHLGIDRTWCIMALRLLIKLFFKI
jgi:Zn-finger nucleic acid-binding protein